MNDDQILRILRENLTEEDYRASSTCQSLAQLTSMAGALYRQRADIDTMVDLGCGYGSLTSAFAGLLDCDEVYGIELDDERRAVAESRGVSTYNIDVEVEQLPFTDDSVDLVLSFGLFEHLKYYDFPLEESNRVLRDGGQILYSVPNLASWVNRLTLLFGNQPRDVEISQHRAFGISERYKRDNVLSHVHSPTYAAFLQLLRYHGFSIDDTVGLFPYQSGRIIMVIDKITSVRPSLCRRIAVLGTKERPSTASQ